MLGMLLQRFEFIDFANYQLETKQTLTIKPDNFHIKVRLRAGRTATAAATGLQPPRPSAPARRGADPHRRRAPHAAAGPVWLQPGHRRRLRPCHRPGRDQPRVRGHGRGARRARRLAANGGGRRHRHRLLQRPAARQRRQVLPVAAGPVATSGCVCRRGVQRLRLREPRLGGDVPGDPDADRRPAGEARREANVRAGEGDARGDFDGDYRAWYGGLWSSVADSTRTCRTAWPRRRPRGPRFSVTFVNKQAANPIIRSYSAVGHDGSRQPRAAASGL